jgi:L-lactate dehydrogenase (cytochrome)
MELDTRYPSISDLARRARRRIPHFAWEYLDSGTGAEISKRRSRDFLDKAVLRPAILGGEVEPDLSISFLGRTYRAPFGIAPVGMSGLFWPGAEFLLAGAATRAGLPYCLSTVAAQGPEDVAPHLDGNGWFQLYPPKAQADCDDLIGRAQEAGFTALVLTVDVPGPSRRERQRRGGVTTPPRMTARLVLHAALRPAWSLAVLRHGMPKVRGLERYIEGTRRPGEVGLAPHRAPDWADWARIRKLWHGPLIAKGVLNPDEALRLRDEGADAVWVSNHGGRQFDAAPGASEALPAIRSALGPGYPVLYDGEVGSGTDVLRALALGADFVMLGRAWHYGAAAFGARGAAHVAHILAEDLRAAMVQAAITRPQEARGLIWRP